jgi:hypothetical protein
MAAHIKIYSITSNRSSGDRLTEGSKVWFYVNVVNDGDVGAPAFIDLREGDRVLDSGRLYGNLDPNVYWGYTVEFNMPARDITVKIVAGHYVDNTKVDDSTSSNYVFYYQPPPPADIRLMSYSWTFYSEGTFPYRPDDVRKAWKLTYTVKNVGGQSSEADITLYLRNAPSYIGERMAYEHLTAISPNDSRTRTLIVPESKGNEYYTMDVTTTSTRIIKSYNLGTTPAINPETGEPTVPETGEISAPEPTVSTATTPIEEMVSPLVQLIMSIILLTAIIAIVKEARD